MRATCRPAIRDVDGEDAVRGTEALSGEYPFGTYVENNPEACRNRKLL